MPFDRLSCPECRTTLKPGKPIAEGKKVKCPKCGNIFVAGAKLSVAAKNRPQNGLLDFKNARQTRLMDLKAGALQFVG